MKILLLFTIFIFFASIAVADSYRCGRKIVKSGDSYNVLVKKCGNPTRKYSSKETVTEGGHRTRVAVSNWVYQRYGKKDMIVSIRSGSVIKIQVE